MSSPRRPPADPENRWRALWLFWLFRLLLVTGLILLYSLKGGPPYLGGTGPALFETTTLAYLLTMMAGAILLLRRRPAPEIQADMMVFSDIIAGVLIMHASGGIGSGLGILLAVSIAIGTLLMTGRSALLLAALATLAVLTEQVYTHLHSGIGATSYSQAGLLGALFFAIAILAHRLSLQLRASEERVSQRELDLANLAQLNDYIIQHMQTGVLVVDNQQRIRLMNDTAWRLLGMPPVRAGAGLDAVSPELRQRLERWRREPQAEITPFRATADGKELRPSFTTLGRERATGTLVFLEDSSVVTRQAQQMKLASLGRLTASIAHEIRNPLGAIGHAGQLLAESPDLTASDQRLTEIISTNTGRVNAIIENVLQLSRRSPATSRDLALKPWLDEFGDEFRRQQGVEGDALQVHVAPETIKVLADPSQLHQILTNLCENALIHSDQAERTRVRIIGGVAPDGDGAFIDIIDNGPGITPEETRQIFEPFFTRRSNGTGLGLYVAKELCEMNRGHLEYIPIPAGGSCFRIHLPTADDEGSESP